MTTPKVLSDVQSELTENREEIGFSTIFFQLQQFHGFFGSCLVVCFFFFCVFLGTAGDNVTVTQLFIHKEKHIPPLFPSDGNLLLPG